MAPIVRRERCRKGISLRNLSILGLVLVVLGVGGLRMGHFSYHNRIPAVDAGPIQLKAHMDRRISVPTVGGFVMLLAGVGFIAVKWRRA